MGIVAASASFPDVLAAQAGAATDVIVWRVVDAATGTVRLKAKVEEADEMTLETRSTKTVRVKK